MLKRWIPSDALLRRALVGLVVGLLLAALAGGLSAWDESGHRGAEHGQEALAQAVAQYGPSSPEAAAAVKQLGETANPKDVVALLDPKTGKALAAWPAELAGKTPDEMPLAGNAKLPSFASLQNREHFTLQRPGAPQSPALAPYETDKVTVQLTPIYPGSMAQDGEQGGRWPHGEGGRQEGRQGQRFGREQGFGRGFGGEHQGSGNEQQGDFRGPSSMPAPQAFLLIAASPAGVTLLQVAAGVAGGLAAVGLAVFWLTTALWVFRDAQRSGRKAWAWGLLALLSSPGGLILYLLTRPRLQACDNCHASSEKRFRYCPHCGHDRRPACAHCGRPLRDGWSHCAHCGAPRVAPPAADVQE